MHSLIAYLVFNRFPEYQNLATFLVVLLCCLPIRSRLMQAMSRPFIAISRRRALAVALTGIFAFVVTSSLALKRGAPIPYVHDEASYLLAADTFAHGRLTNPSPPIWEPFETMHVLVRPTYMSKYPPGQGLFLALGQVMTGKPIWGVWISNTLAAACTCWMLYAFVSTRWALLGALLMALHPQMLEWGQRYWGGSVAVIGGALFLGGVGRLMRQPKPTAAIWMAIGILILANTRPFEGLVITLLLMSGLLIWLLRRGVTIETVGRKIFAPMSLVLLPGAIWMGYYNWRITGHALRLPYQEHHSQYGAAPLFIFQKPIPAPQYHNREMQLFYARDQVWNYQQRKSPGQFFTEARNQLEGLIVSWFGNASVLAIGLLILSWSIKASRRLRLLTLTLIVFAILLLSETYMYGHYAAPAAGLACAITVMTLRRLRRYGGAVGRLVVRTALAVFILWSLMWWIGFFGWQQDASWWQVRRARIEQEIAQKPGKHLILVRYHDHNVHEEWVYNGADLDDAKVLWARELEDPINRRLLDHYRDRTVWLLQPDNPADIAALIAQPR